MNKTLLAIVSSRLKMSQEMSRSLHLSQNLYSGDVAVGVETLPLTKPSLFLADNVSIIDLFQLWNPVPLNFTETSCVVEASQG